MKHLSFKNDLRRCAYSAEIAECKRRIDELVDQIKLFEAHDIGSVSGYHLAEELCRILFRRMATLRKAQNKIYRILWYFLKNEKKNFFFSDGWQFHPFLKKHYTQVQRCVIMIKKKYTAYDRYKEELRQIEVAHKKELDALKVWQLRPDVWDLYVQPDAPQTSWCVEDEPDMSNSRVVNKIYNKTKLDYSNILIGPLNVYKEYVKEINVEAKGRLRHILNFYKELRSKGYVFSFDVCSPFVRRMVLRNIQKFVNPNFDLMSIAIEPAKEVVECVSESDTLKDEKGEPIPSTSKAQNVELEETNPAEADHPVQIRMADMWERASSSDVKDGYDALTGRWIEIKQFTWTKDQGPLTELVNMELPKDILTMDNDSACSRPNTIPFKINAMANYDLEIKIQLNAQKFQIGQLIASWFYLHHLDSKFVVRKNLCNLSQTLHGLITANVSNEITLQVPYNNITPFIRTRARSDMPDANNMGNLLLTVLNPLTVSSTGASQCSGTIWCRFTRAAFTGTISGSFGAALGIQCVAESVFSGVLGAVAKELMTTMTDANRDNPPNPIPPNMLVPTASHSWSVGQGMVEPLHPLRLDGRGQTPYVQNKTDEMVISSIIEQFAFVKSYEVTKDMAPGYLIQKWEAAPMMDKSQYIKNTLANSADMYSLPPLAVVSSLFNYWRGSIKFRFDLIYSTVGQNARFLVAYVPGALSSDNVTLSQAKSCPHIVISLGENQSVTYEIPFISHRPFWSRNYTGNYDIETVQPPSMVYMYVLNSLVPMESVSSKMYINLWVAAGSDFELAIPIQPSIGLGFNRKILYNTVSEVHAKEGYYPYYWGAYFRSANSTVLTLRHLTTSGASSVFEERYAKLTVANKRGYYYTPESTDDMPQYQDNKGAFKYVEAALICQTSEDGDWIMVACDSIKSATTLCLSAVPGWITGLTSAISGLIPVGSTTNNTWGKGNPAWVAHEVVRDHEEFVHLNLEGPEKSEMSTNSSLASLNYGKIVFGEKFNHFKDLARRYNFYCAFIIDSVKAGVAQCAVIIPILYQGLDLDIGSPKQIKEQANRCREGHIPIIASGYRFGSGSIRFRLVVPANYNVSVWIQHRPDRGLRSRKMIPCREIVTAESVVNHSYASYLQVTSVNGVIEFEVPMYVPGPVVHLQVPKLTSSDDRLFASLGEIAIGVVADSSGENKLKKLPCTLFYSLGDDAKFSLFQGFPPMILLDDIADVPVVVQPEGPVFEYAFGGLFKSASKEVAAEVKEQIADMATPLIEQVDDAVKKSMTATSFFQSISEHSFIKVLIDKVIHIAISPDIKTIAWSCVGLLVELGVLVSSTIDKAMKAFLSFLTLCKQRLSSNEPKTEDVVIVEAESDLTPEEYTAASGILTVIWTGLCTTLSYNGRLQRNEENAFVNLLVKDMRLIFQSSNGLFTFLKNIFTALQYAANIIIRKLYPQLQFWEELSEGYEEIKAWYDEVYFLTDMTRREQVYCTHELIERVYLACDLGALYLGPSSSFLKEKEHFKIISSLRTAYQGISKLKDECVAMGLDPHIRKCCFTIAMYGESGIGKSHVTDKVCAHLLKKNNHRYSGPMICTVNPTDKYWSQCVRQPVLLMDDLWAVEAGELLYQQIALVNAICSPVPLTPPMAELSDKKMRYNPEIFWYNTNKPFPKFDRVDETMLWRRRDVLIKARHIGFDEQKEGCEHCKKQLRPQYLKKNQLHLLKDYHHLRFGIHDDVCKPQSDDDFEWLTYEELLEVLTEKFMDNRERETSKFKESVEAYQSTIEDLFIEEQPLHEKIAALKAKFSDITLQIQNSTYKNYLASYWTTCSDYVRDCAQSLNPADRITEYWKNFLVLPVIQPEAPPLETIDEGSEEADSLMESIQSSNPEVFFNLTQYLVDGCPPMRELDRLFSQLIYNGLDQDRNERLVMNLVMTGYHRGYVTKEMVQEMYGAVCFKEQNNYTICHVMVRHYITEIAKVRTCHDWFDVYKSVTSAYSQLRPMLNTVLKKCVHYSWTPNDLYWVANTGWSYKGLISKFECDENSCPFKMLAVKRAFFKQWLKLNPRERILYMRGKLDSLPPEFGKMYHSFPDMVGWKAMCKYGIEKVISFFSVAVKKIWDWLIIWGIPLITLVLTVSCMVLGYETTKLDNVQRQQRHDAYISACNRYQPGPSTSRPPRWSQPESAYNLNIGSAPKVPIASVVRPESESQQSEVVQKLIFRNFFYLTGSYDGKFVTYRCLVLQNRECLILRHYVEELNAMPPHTMYFGRFNNTVDKIYKYGVQFDYRNCSLIWFKNYTNGSNSYMSNYGVLSLPLCFPEGKNLVKFIAPSTAHQHVGGEGILITDQHTHSSLRIERNVSRTYSTASTDIISSVTMDDVYTYPKHGRGMCGSILIAPNLQRPIIGMHVAGYSGVGESGIAEVLCSEMFDYPTEINSPPIVLDQSIRPNLTDEEFSKIDLTTNIFPYGCVSGKFVQSQSNETQIIPSIIQGVVPVTTAPNPLKPSDKRLPKGSHPLFDGIAHKGKPPLDFDPQLLSECADDLESVILTAVQPVRSMVGVVDLQTAICGSSELAHYDAIELNTSVGYPLSSIKQTNDKGKRWILKLKETPQGYLFEGMHEELVRIYELEMAMRKRNIRPFTVFVDCLKDTCLPIEKNSVPGKTRIFSISPIQFSIPFRQYCLDFMASYQKARFSAEHAIGINCQSLEWNQMTNLLLKNSAYIVTGDYKNFGPGLMKSCAWEACKIILSWYKLHGCDEEHINVLRIMLYEIVDAYYLCNDTIYQTPCGIPSGSPITAPLNSLVNSLYIRYAFRKITNLSFSEFRNNIRLITYGDDLIMSVKSPLIEIFNCQSISHCFSLYNIIFTDQDKTKSDLKFRDILSATFLKRSFVKCPQIGEWWVAKIEEESINSCINWISKKNNIFENTIQNCNAALLLSVEHGPEFYKQLSNKLILALKEHNVKFFPEPWTVLKKNFYSV